MWATGYRTVVIRPAWRCCATRQVVELGENYMMVEVAAPRHFIQRSIQQLQIRSRYGVQVLLIKKPDGKNNMAHFVPSPDYIIQEDDVLLLAGDNQSIQRARHL